MEKKVAFVTGGSRGIGREIVKTLARDGFKVGFSYVNNDQASDELIQELEEKGYEVFKKKFDVSDFEACKVAFKEIEDEIGSIDVLVNNAGTTKDKLFLRMKEDDFDTVINTNLKGVFNCSKQVVRQMTKKKYGRIISMSSIVALVGNMGQVNYSASKAGVIGFTRTLAVELGSYNITVNAICPGFIDTDMTRAVKPEIIEKIIYSLPIKKPGQVEDVAELVSFLASDKAKYITGQAISVDGGMSVI